MPKIELNYSESMSLILYNVPKYHLRELSSFIKKNFVPLRSAVLDVVSSKSHKIREIKKRFACTW